MTKRTFPSKLLPLIQALGLISFAPTSFASANFLIDANGQQPTTVFSGEPATANYILTNLTNSARLGYSIQGLPPTVIQDTSGSNCPSVINLPAHGSCPLVFTVVGEAHSTFAVCKGNSCTTATTPINVTLVPNSRLVAGGGYCNTSFCFPLLAQSLINTPWTYPSSILNTPPGQYSNPTFLGASCAGNLCIAAGGDNISNIGIQPWVAMSTSFGDNWTYPVGDGINWPSDINVSVGLFHAAACADTTWCIAAGRYENTPNQVNVPMVVQYLNGNWTYVVDTSHVPPDMWIRSNLNTASCAGNTCIAGGTFEDNPGGNNPRFTLFLAQSNDHGATWTFPISPSSAQPSNINTPFISQFLGSSCSGLICIAVGSYQVSPNNNSYPVIALTTNGGTSYSYVVDTTHNTLPSDYTDNASFNSASCSGNLCIAGGFYAANPGSGATNYNVLIQSTDGGTTWTYPITATQGPQPSDWSNTGRGFNSVSCSGQTCIAAGSYQNGSAVTFPYLAQSTNGGVTWTTVVDSTLLLPPNFQNNGSFNAASCTSTTCFAAGTYQDTNGVQLPLLIESVLGGPWTYKIDNDIATLPDADITSGAFQSSAASQTLARIKDNNGSVN